MILCDAGVLLCLVDRTQPQHIAYQNAVMPLAKPLVFDTNTIVSGILFENSKPDRALRLMIMLK